MKRKVEKCYIFLFILCFHISQPVTTETRFNPVLYNRHYSSVAALRSVSLIFYFLIFFTCSHLFSLCVVSFSQFQLSFLCVTLFWPHWFTVCFVVCRKLISISLHSHGPKSELTNTHSFSWLIPSFSSLHFKWIQKKNKPTDLVRALVFLDVWLNFHSDFLNSAESFEDLRSLIMKFDLVYKVACWKVYSLWAVFMFYMYLFFNSLDFLKWGSVERSGAINILHVVDGSLNSFIVVHVKTI